jgi:hypothetical protein
MSTSRSDQCEDGPDSAGRAASNRILRFAQLLWRAVCMQTAGGEQVERDRISASIEFLAASQERPAE